MQDKMVNDLIGLLSLTLGDVAAISAINEYNIKKEGSSISKETKKLDILNHIFCKTLESEYFGTLHKVLKNKDELIDTEKMGYFQNRVISYKDNLVVLASYVSNAYNIDPNELVNSSLDELEKKYSLKTKPEDPGLTRFLFAKSSLVGASLSAVNMEFSLGENIDVVDSSIGKDIADSYEKDIQTIIDKINKSKSIIETSKYNLELCRISRLIFVDYCKSDKEELNSFLNMSFFSVKKVIEEIVS